MYTLTFVSHLRACFLCLYLDIYILLYNINLDHDGREHGAYFGIDISPLEVMFIKTNRDYRRIQTETIDKYTEWADTERRQRLKEKGCG